ncbi:AAA domain-containing protein [Roseibium hamelinense]|uniref:AAA domain-containing protein n=1 Tax=Roseibium hamelinense TaxID=150831 RepID=A0A562SPW6_9HYPH|nr:AAA family ATPase [Roseibium hamelinense]MTI44072.1 hypothetical protein [Roseibium hamelinense]TWI82720.1 AAA domain-containing protein [Roseibium hamelinense]
MGTVLVINGPSGVGKSTVTHRLSIRLGNSVHISGDIVRSFTPENASAFLGHGSTYQAAGRLATTYLELGAKFVLFDYVFQNKRQTDLLVSTLPANADVNFFTLWAPWEAVRAREVKRGRNVLPEQVAAERYRQIENALPVLGTCIDNTSSLEQTVEDILSLVASAL